VAKGQFHTPYQKGIIKRYYENKSDLCSQKLGEIVSDLYLETKPARITQLWESAETAALTLGANKARLAKIVAERNLPALAKLAEELF